MSDIFHKIFLIYPLFILYYFLFGYFFSTLAAKFPERKIQKAKPKNKIKIDIRNSLICLLLSSIFLSLGIHFKEIGVAKGDFITGYYYFDSILSIAIGLFLLDTVIYFSHRAYHINNKIFRIFHLPHHKNNNIPTVWGTYNEDPLGFTIAQCFFVYVVFIVPISIPALITLNVLAMTFDIMGHSDHDILPKSYLSANIVDHDLHHKEYNCNYAPYFTVWDRIFGTYKG